MRLDSALDLVDFSALSKSSMIDVVWYPIRNLSSTFFEFDPLFLHLLGSHLVQFLQFSGRLKNSGSSLSTSDSGLRISFQMLGGSGLSVGVPCSFFRTSFLVPEAALTDVSCSCCCCCRCDCQALLSTIFGAGRGVESLSNKVLSPF